MQSEYSPPVITISSKMFIAFRFSQLVSQFQRDKERKLDRLDSIFFSSFFTCLFTNQFVVFCFFFPEQKPDFSNCWFLTNFCKPFCLVKFLNIGYLGGFQYEIKTSIFRGLILLPKHRCVCHFKHQSYPVQPLMSISKGHESPIGPVSYLSALCRCLGYSRASEITVEACVQATGMSLMAEHQTQNIFSSFPSEIQLSKQRHPVPYEMSQDIQNICRELTDVIQDLWKVSIIQSGIQRLTRTHHNATGSCSIDSSEILETYLLFRHLRRGN